VTLETKHEVKRNTDVFKMGHSCVAKILLTFKTVCILYGFCYVNSVKTFFRARPSHGLFKIN